MLQRALLALRAGGLVLVTAGTVAAWPDGHPDRLAVAVAGTVLGVLGWLAWMVGFPVLSAATRPPDLPWHPLAYAAMGVGGGLALGADGNGTASVYAFVAVVGAMAALRRRPASVVVASTVGVTVVAVVAGPLGTGAAASFGLGLLAAALAGLSRAQATERARQTELLLAETRRAAGDRERAAALEERGRIAREVHDVLAHSLAGLGIQLEAARLLLDAGRAGEAVQHVVRAQELAHEGTSETRQALQALRGEPVDLPTLLGEQLAAYQADTGGCAEASYEVEVPVPPETAVTVARVTREVLTNARRHAPGAAVVATLRSDAAGVRLELTDSGPAEGRTPAGSGSGYGLTGVRERAALAGGSVVAGPHGSGWRVVLELPAHELPAHELPA
jgi:signal transduction histidine kinase